MFLADAYPYDVKPVFLSSCNHYAEEKFEIFYDHKLILREQERHQFSNRGSAIDVKLFLEDQHVFDLPFKDLVATFMELYFSEILKFSYFSSLPIFSGEYDLQKEFILLLLHFKHKLLLSD